MQLPYKFGRYVLVNRIAQGGMAEIYRAKYFGEGGFVKDVAIKRILPVWSDNKEFTTMLCDEAKALVNLQHQNIVQVYELGKDNGTFYISMEYVEGLDVRQLFRKAAGEGRPLPVKFTCYIIGEILKGLNFAHTRTDKQGRSLGIIHRDISPQNVLISFNGEIKVADFGIAKGNHRSFETVVAQVKGKYAYMSPEQAKGEEIDARADLYSVGIILYELLTGKRLHDSTSDLKTIEDVKRSTLPECWEGDVPMGIRPIVRKALHGEAGDRYQGASEFLGDLNRYVVANRLVTHGLEFSLLLKTLFKDEYERYLNDDDTPFKDVIEGLMQETMALNAASKTVAEPKGRAAAFKRYKWHAAAAAAVVIISLPLVAGRFIRPLQNTPKAALSADIASPDANGQVKPPPAVSPMPKIEMAAVTLPANGTGAAAIAPLKAAEPIGKEPVPTAKPAVSAQNTAVKKDGILNVQARPWGYVYIPGKVSRQETPVRGVKLKAGEYVVKVNFEPEDKWVQQKVTIADNSSTNCLADFGGKSVLTCKSVK